MKKFMFKEEDRCVIKKIADKIFSDRYNTVLVKSIGGKIGIIKSVHDKAMTRPYFVKIEDDHHWLDEDCLEVLAIDQILDLEKEL